ncbi:MAG: sigma 54-interacting transcriptional regulator [Nitrospirae bacterium]|nr:sigma 54-interacting transcriptional regulator [Nitrospirota bacterium]
MFQTSKYKFAFISNSAELEEMVRAYSDASTEDLSVVLATMEEAIPVAKKLLNEGVEIILGGWGTGSLLIRTIGQPVVKIERTYLDILRALIQAKEYSASIGLTSFGAPIPGIEILQNLLSIKIKQIVFNSARDLADGISEAARGGIHCIVGGGICRDIITSLGGVGIVVLPSGEAVLQALQEARAIAGARRKEQDNAIQLRTVLETVKDGIVVIGNSGDVKFFNHMAAHIFGVELQKALGQPLPTFAKETGLLKVLETGLPETDKIRRVGNIDIVINSIPVLINGEVRGVVGTFKEASRIQDIERKLREKLYVKGFAARYTIDHIVFGSPVMRQLIEKTKKYAQTDATVLIQGETGTGKELFAQSIHNMSPRKDKPFVAINCSALPESLLESELFGYEEGAFTGARRGGKIGLFELVNGGTLFLDEIADVSLGLQAKLLRVLEEKEVMRIGGDQIVPVDLRVISSTYKDLWEEVRCRRFRMDLYFRLEILKLTLPPLRERPDDIPDIALACLYRNSKGNKKISAEMLEHMKQLYWPGNIRQLDSLIKRYIVLLGEKASDDRLIKDLLEELKGQAMTKKEETITFHKPAPVTDDKTLKQRVEEFERSVIADGLEKSKYDKKETARKLGISLNTLWRKLKTSNDPS